MDQHIKLIDLEKEKLERKMQLQLSDLFDGPWVFTVDTHNQSKEKDISE